MPIFSFPESTYFDLGWHGSSLSCFLTTHLSVSQVPWGSCVPWWIKFITCTTRNGSILQTSPGETTPGSDRNLCKDTVWPSGLTGISEATIGSSVYQISHTVHLSPPISSEGPYPGSCPEQHLFFCCSMLCRFRILFFTIFLFKEFVTFWKCILLTWNFLYKVLHFCVCMHLSSVELT